MRNPFKPTAGARPPLLVGRSGIREEYAESLADGSGAPGLLSIFTGPRGVGKTVILSELEDEALQHGWVIISETATAGLVDRVHRSLSKALEELGDGPIGRRLTSVNIGPVGIGTELPSADVPHWRETATELLQNLDSRETGLVISIDEIHAVDRRELTELSTVVQHFIREGLPISLLMAGLPRAVSDLLNDDVATFLRRADRHDLHSAPVSEVREAFAETFRDSGVIIDEPQLESIAQATGGYPFLIQLVGYHVWSKSKHISSVDDESLRLGVQAAYRRMGSTVLQASLQGLSDIDKSYLLRMAEDEGPSRTSAISERMGVTSNYANVYRARLIDAGLIEQSSYGHVDFVVPRMREFLRDQPGFKVHPPV